LPYMFEKYQLSSSFIANFGDSMISLSIFIGIMVVFWGLDYSCQWLRNMPILRKFAARGKITMQNYVISQFYGASGDIIFYTTLELRAVRLENKYATLSFASCFVCLLIGLSFIFVHFWILYKYQNIKKNAKQLEQFKNKFQGMQLFFEDFKDNSFGQQAFLFYSLIRNIVFNLTMGLLFAYPLMQTLMIVLLGLFMIIYLIFKRPLKSRLELAQQLSFELSLLIATSSCVVMATLDLSDNDFTNLRERASSVIIYINIIFNFLPLVFLSISIIEASWEGFQWIRKKSLNSGTKKRALEKSSIDDSQIRLEGSSMNDSAIQIKEYTPKLVASDQRVQAKNGLRTRIPSPNYLPRIVSPQRGQAKSPVKMEPEKGKVNDFGGFNQGETLEMKRSFKKRHVTRLSQKRNTIRHQSINAYPKISLQNNFQRPGNSNSTSVFDL